MGDKNHGFAELLLQRFELLLDFPPGDRIERTERLIEQNDRRVGSERPSDADALALAAGKLPRIAPRETIGIESDHRQQCSGAGLNPIRVPSLEARHHTDIFFNREMGK